MKKLSTMNLNNLKREKCGNGRSSTTTCSSCTLSVALLEVSKVGCAAQVLDEIILKIARSLVISVALESDPRPHFLTRRVNTSP